MRIKWLTILLYPQTGEEEQVKAELGGFIGVSKLTFRALALRQSVVKSTCSERRFLFFFFPCKLCCGRDCYTDSNVKLIGDSGVVVVRLS